MSTAVGASGQHDRFIGTESVSRVARAEQAKTKGMTKEERKAQREAEAAAAQAQAEAMAAAEKAQRERAEAAEQAVTHGVTTPLPRRYHGVTTTLPRYYHHDVTMASPRRHHAVSMPSACRHHAVTMLSPCCHHAVTTQSPCRYHAVTMPLLLPQVCGGQIVGVVTAVGEAVKKFKAGDRVGFGWLKGADELLIKHRSDPVNVAWLERARAPLTQTHVQPAF